MGFTFAIAENYPYRSDYLWYTVPDHRDWLYMTWGYNDNTCPPTTSYAVWNTLTCPKECLITPINEHWTSDATNRAQCAWIMKNL